MFGEKYMSIENENSGQIIGYLLGICGSLIVFGGILCGYIWKRHVLDNDCKFQKNDDEHSEFRGHVHEHKHK
jgi:hypothetical protein